MSGFEIAGVALALLPLLISAAENYDRCAAPFSRFKNFPKEARRLLQGIDIQKVIFHNQCQILLENVVDQDVAAIMIQTAEHHLWHDIELEARLAQILEPSRGACIATIELIGECLKAVESDCQNSSASLAESKLVGVVSKFPPASFRRPAECKPPCSRKGVKDAVKHVCGRKSRTATKLRFSVSKSRLRKILDDLQTHNDNFRTLVTPSFTASHKRRASENHKFKDVEREINRYVIVGKASREVFEALSRSCTKHTEHLAHTCAEVECTFSGKNQAPRLKFQMALSSSLDHKDTVCFIVDTTVEDLESRRDKSVIVDLKGLEQTIKRELDCPADTAERKPKKSVRFESSAVMATPVYPKITRRDPFSLDIRIKKDFCDRLRRCSNQGLRPETCMGILEANTGCEHYIFPATTPSCSDRHQAVTLGHMISSLSKQSRLGNFPLYERLRLAKVLTVAVLQYHATPWLHGSWRSDDVTFLGDDAVSLLRRTSPLKAPHLYATVRGCESSQASAVRKETENASGAARNSLLYSLGILLLEIGYWTKWEDLSRSREGEYRYQDRYTQFYQARNLLKSGRSDMGPRYDSIVEQLIECDFGCGDDLSTVRLQTAVHRNVICPLDELESGIRKLQLGT